MTYDDADLSVKAVGCSACEFWVHAACAGLSSVGGGNGDIDVGDAVVVRAVVVVVAVILVFGGSGGEVGDGGGGGGGGGGGYVGVWWRRRWR